MTITYQVPQGVAEALPEPKVLVCSGGLCDVYADVDLDTPVGSPSVMAVSPPPVV